MFTVLAARLAHHPHQTSWCFFSQTADCQSALTGNQRDLDLDMGNPGKQILFTNAETENGRLHPSPMAQNSSEKMDLLRQPSKIGPYS
jgi:hypothetical protein